MTFGSIRLRSQLLTFFSLTFLIAWSAWIPLFHRPSLPSQIAFIGLFAPAVTAIFTALLYDGMRSVRDILRRLAIVRISPLWPLVSAFVMPAIYLAALGALNTFNLRGSEPLFTRNSPFFILAGFVWLCFVTLGEELGWRGYALPRLLETFPHPIWISLGLGLIWGLWHLPLYLIPGQSAFPLPLFLIFTALQSALYTVIFARTEGSLIPALLLHAGTDIAPRIFQLSLLPSTFWIIVDLTLAFVVMGLVIASRPQLQSVQQVCGNFTSSRPRRTDLK